MSKNNEFQQKYLGFNSSTNDGTLRNRWVTHSDYSPYSELHDEEDVSNEEVSEEEEDDYEWIKKENGSYIAYCTSCRRKCEHCPVCEKEFEEGESDDEVLESEEETDDESNDGRRKRRHGSDSSEDSEEEESSEDEETSEDDESDHYKGKRRRYN